MTTDVNMFIEGEEKLGRDFVMTKNNVSTFSGTRHYMGMLFKSRFRINGNEFESVEHYYQYTKLKELLPDEIDFQKKVMKCKVTRVRFEIMRFLRDKGITRDLMNEWKNRRAAAVLFDGNKAKFDNNRVIKDKLLNTGTRVLVNTFDGDNVFTSGSRSQEFYQWLFDKNHQFTLPENLQCYQANDFPFVHKGRNVLGFILMELRNLYRSQQKFDVKPIPSLTPPVFQAMNYQKILQKTSSMVNTVYNSFMPSQIRPFSPVTNNQQFVASLNPQQVQYRPPSYNTTGSLPPLFPSVGIQAHYIGGSQPSNTYDPYSMPPPVSYNSVPPPPTPPEISSFQLSSHYNVQQNNSSYNPYTFARI